MVLAAAVKAACRLPSPLPPPSQAITNLTGFAVECASLPPAWQTNATLLNDQVFCGWGASECAVRGGAKAVLPPQARGGGIQCVGGAGRGQLLLLPAAAAAASVACCCWRHLAAAPPATLRGR